MSGKMIGVCVMCLVAASCNSEQKAKPPESSAATSPKTDAKQSVAMGKESVSYTPGDAGGKVERVINATATVSAVDVATRKVTLTAADGTKGIFTAPPEVRNLEQLRVGDKVNATLNEQLVVFVGPKREPSMARGDIVARAPKGAKPGAIAAEMFEVVADVAAIDSANRIATLKLDDGKTIDVAVRPDVDLTKYKVGDSVTIRVTQQLRLVAESP